MDWFSRVVLAVIAVCMALLVAQGYAEAPGDADTAGASNGRFSVIPVPMARMMLRIDTHSGETWRTTFPNGRSWIRIAEEGEPAGEVPEEEAELEEAPTEGRPALRFGPPGGMAPGGMAPGAGAAGEGAAEPPAQP